jgi:hypothetical protein
LQVISASEGTFHGSILASPPPAGKRQPPRGGA